MVSRRNPLGAVAVIVFTASVAAISWFGLSSRQSLPHRPGQAHSPVTTSDPETAFLEKPSVSDQGPAPSTSHPAAPSFDVVRVEPNGEMVVAGRSAPGTSVQMLVNGVSHAQTDADTSGLFAFLPPPLPPGSHEVVLEATARDGARVRSRQSVTVFVSEDRTTKPLVALASAGEATVLLSSPAPGAPKTKNARHSSDQSSQHDVASSPSSSGAVSADESGERLDQIRREPIRIITVDAEEGGRLFVTGRAEPGAAVRFYLNEVLIAPGTVGRDGRVSFAIDRGVRPGSYRIRLDDVDLLSGTVKMRAEVNFAVPAQLAASSSSASANRMSVPPSHSQAEAFPKAGTGRPDSDSSKTVLVPEVSTALVSRRDNLWAISKRVYGAGHRYTEIYQANQAHIGKADLIYPGQVFVLPADSRSRQ